MPTLAGVISVSGEKRVAAGIVAVGRPFPCAGPARTSAPPVWCGATATLTAAAATPPDRQSRVGWRSSVSRRVTQACYIERYRQSSRLRAPAPAALATHWRGSWQSPQSVNTWRSSWQRRQPEHRHDVGLLRITSRSATGPWHSTHVDLGFEVRAVAPEARSRACRRRGPTEPACPRPRRPPASGSPADRWRSPGGTTCRSRSPGYVISLPGVRVDVALPALQAEREVGLVAVGDRLHRRRRRRLRQQHAHRLRGPVQARRDRGEQHQGQPDGEPARRNRHGRRNGRSLGRGAV